MPGEIGKRIADHDTFSPDSFSFHADDNTDSRLCHIVYEKQNRESAAGRSTFTIDWKGDLLACNHLDMIREHPLEDGFQEAWKRINRKVKEWPTVPECRGCPYEHVCSNCAAQVLRYGEAGKLPAELCERTMCLVQHGLRSLPGCE